LTIEGNETVAFRPDVLTTSAYGRLLEGMLEQAAGYALSILRNRADAEDAVQQAALRGLERLSLYDPRQPFRGWWFTVLRHCCIDLLRSRRAHASLGQAECQAARLGNPTHWQDLAEALDRLEPQQAEMLRLRYFAGLTYDELGQALAIPKGTVASRLHYARKALSSQMKGSEP
jgi:RNA polymerase sigma-70 factor (ECF subfamily)